MIAHPRTDVIKKAAQENAGVAKRSTAAVL
jgi:hypothetical protein